MSLCSQGLCLCSSGSWTTETWAAARLESQGPKSRVAKSNICLSILTYYALLVSIHWLYNALHCVCCSLWSMQFLQGLICVCPCSLVDSSAASVAEHNCFGKLGSWQLHTALQLALLRPGLACNWILQIDHDCAFYLERIRLKPFHGVSLSSAACWICMGLLASQQSPIMFAWLNWKSLVQGLGLAIYLYNIVWEVAKEEIELMRPSSSHRLHVRVFTAELVPLDLLLRCQITEWKHQKRQYLSSTHTQTR